MKITYQKLRKNENQSKKLTIGQCSQQLLVNYIQLTTLFRILTYSSLTVVNCAGLRPHSTTVF